MFVANVAVITSVACDLDTKLGCVETYMSCQLKPGGQETGVGYLPSLRICRDLEAAALTKVYMVLVSG